MTEMELAEAQAVTPVRVKDLPAFLMAIEAFARDLAQGDDILSVLTRHADAVITATAIGAGVRRDWLEEQDLDVLVALAARVVEVNADFFAQRVLPRVTEAAERITRTFDALSMTGLSRSAPPASTTGV